MNAERALAMKHTQSLDERGFASHLDSYLTPTVSFDLRHRFQRDGFILVGDMLPWELRKAVREEVLMLLDKHAERRDLFLETTDNTPRFMSVVRSEFIAANGDLIRQIYNYEPLVKALTSIAGERLFSCPSDDEEFLITRQEKRGDTHGWHWGDFSFALIWIVDTPHLGAGGMLQCVPHTRWDKSQPRIHEYLCENSIATYGFVPGDVYFLRTDTTLHRTVPLNTDTRRIIINMTWAAQKDLDRAMLDKDRWWENGNVEAAQKAL